MGSSHQGFYPNAPFFQDGGYTVGELLSTFRKKQKKCIYLRKTCHYISFL